MRSHIMEQETRGRLWMAMGCYALIAGSVFLTMEGPFRAAVWLLLFGLAAKTLIAHFAPR